MLQQIQIDRGFAIKPDIQWMDVKSMFKYQIVSLILLFWQVQVVTFSILKCHSGLDNLGAHYYMNVICGVLMIIFYAISCISTCIVIMLQKYLICNRNYKSSSYKKINQKFFRVCRGQ